MNYQATDIDSDFYGNEDDVKGLEAQVASLDTSIWWAATRNPSQGQIERRIERRERPTAPTETFNTPISMKLPPVVRHDESPKSKLKTPSSTTSGQNSYAGVPYAWQLPESVDSFLKRLPPSTTPRTAQTPWIFICNPHWNQPLAQKSSTPANDVHGCENEAPLPLNGTDLAKFVRGGMERLHITAGLLDDLRRSSLPQGKKTKETKSEQDLCSSDILGLANILNVRAGKWMLFPRESDVDQVWHTVATLTVKGELGIAAKVEPKPGPNCPGHVAKKERLVCVYTYDFRDWHDLKRVLNKLRQAGLAGDKQVYYKADAYTYLGISSGNPWGLRASLHGSNEFRVE
ncbi:hypothetical protein MKZ38_005697 [Zalerion maritima]|uniref:DUF1917-domain-containing protein n=1 Tax=Zalerion maritima TaxID=339359 RepID=A0AAD5RJV7_9PEZI|nr:hypothetical protein MKZ38_005697 [Zalerion maritima]